MHKHEVHQFVAVNKSEVTSVSTEAYSLRSERAKRNHHAELGAIHLATKLGNHRLPNAALGAFDLSFDYWRFKPKLISMCDDVHAAVWALWRHSASIAPHGTELVGNEVGKSVAFQFGSKSFEDIVTCCLLDFFCDVGDGLICLRRLRRGFANENGNEFVGKLANLKEAERRTNFIKCALRKLRGVDFSQLTGRCCG